MKITKQILAFLFLFNAFHLNAQETYLNGNYKGTIPKILKKLRNKHELKFAFDYGALKNYKVDLFLSQSPVEEALISILENTNYTFKKIDNTYVIFPIAQKEILSMSLYGKVVDQSNGEPLPFASIGFSQSTQGTFSNDDGSFSLKNIENMEDSLIIRFLGYRSFQKPIKAFVNGSFNLIELEQIQQFLPTVQITSQKSLSISSEKELSSYNVNAQKINELPFTGAPDLFKSLQLFPGINAGNETSSELNIRGGRSDENLVLLDGFKLYNLDHFFGIFSTINPDIIKDIRVFKSGFDAKYGSRVSGVIDLSGKEGNAKRPSGSLSFNTINITGLIETPIVNQKLTFITAIRRAHSDIYQNPIYQNLFGSAFDTSANSRNQGLDLDGEESPDFNFYDVYSKLTFKPDLENNFSLTFFRGQDNFSVRDTSNFNGNQLLRINQNDYNFDWGNIGVGALWTKQWDDNVFSKVTIGQSSFNRNYHRLFQIIDRDENTGAESRDIYSNAERSQLQDFTLNANVFVKRTIDEEIGFGYEGTVISIAGINNSIDSIERSTLNFDLQGITHSLWTSYNREMGDTKFKLGLRATHYSITNEFYISPRVIITRKIDDNFTLHVNAGRYFQFVRRTNRQNIFLNQPERWLIANNDSIPVLISTQFNGGIRYSEKEWVIEFEGFIKNMEGNILNRNDILLLELVEQTNSIAKGTANIGGIEFFIQKKRGRHTGYASMSFSQALEFYRESGNEINDGNPIFSPDNRTYDLKTAYQYNLTNWQFSTNFLWSSGTHFTPLLGVFQVNGPFGIPFTKAEYAEEFSATLQDYLTLNLAVNYRKFFNWVKMDLGISVNNVTNRKNVKSLNYIPIFENGELSDVVEDRISLLGITPSLNLKLSF
ncbi:MAG: carboxypeptidase-like regulatory domain-containing protein [Bacteroidota bacterium]